eukprot:TRINITY_DN29331_c0_g1_i1.p1 TRINITY_DN29331_c0_g1~~TRINITY_DN29331_c0_g1_i1.p1  ORF type:complete len:300 (-),score=62.44 TRINITY_DN29331_c0_g1_i1:181-1080(-)
MEEKHSCSTVVTSSSLDGPAMKPLGEQCTDIDEQNDDSMAPDVQAKIEQMRRILKDKLPGSEVVDDVKLQRFLNSRSLNVEKAFDFYLDYVKWRKSFVPLGYIPESMIVEQLQKNIVCVQGFDKKGRAIAVIFPARHTPCNKKIDDLKRLFVYTFDKMSASIAKGYTTFAIIVDLQDWTYRNVDITGALAVLKILQDYYPEQLGKLYLVHLPFIFWAAWKIIYPFIDKTTREKILLIVDDDVTETLLHDIDESQLPENYGGKLPLCPIQDVIVPNWPPKLCINAQKESEAGSSSLHTEH